MPDIDKSKFKYYQIEKESKTAGKENCTSYALRLFGISGYFK